MNKKTIKDFVLSEEKDGLDIDEVVQHGCVSGIVGSLIYYSDTVKLYDEHKTRYGIYWKIIHKTMALIISLNLLAALMVLRMLAA